MSRLFGKKKKEEKQLNIPKHVAIILDGNGRWAKKHNMPRNYGHIQGSKNVETICEDAYKLGIEYLTFYAFSSENWKRPKEEVDALMGLLRKYMETCLETSKKNNIRVRVIGDISRLDQDIIDSITNLEEASAVNTGLKLQIAINYGGRDEIVRGIRKMYSDIENGKISKDDITEKMVSAYLDTADIPDPDLIIRTSGETRVSNFLLWQLSYSEFYFPEVLWPDFDKDELIKAIEYYSGKDRRYGGLSKKEKESDK